MSPIERLRWAAAPVQGRATALLWGGLALLAASGGVATIIEAPPLVSALLYLAMITGWIVAGCGMVGYMRWFFRQSAAETREMQSRQPKEK